MLSDKGRELVGIGAALAPRGQPCTNFQTKQEQLSIRGKEVILMPNTSSSKGKYVLAALTGAAAGGLIVAFSTRAMPKMISAMTAHCERMMAGMAQADGEAGNRCQRLMARTGQGSEHASCGSSCNS